MKNNRMVSEITQLDAIMRVQGLTQPEIRAYVSSLKKTYAKYGLTLREARRAIDESMKGEPLTAVLYEARNR